MERLLFNNSLPSPMIKSENEEALSESEFDVESKLEIWDVELKKEFSKFIIYENGKNYNSFIQGYLRLLNHNIRYTQSKVNIISKFVSHGKFFQHFYREMQDASKENELLDQMEDIMTVYCNLEMGELRVAKKCVIEKIGYMSFIKATAQRICLVLQMFLSHSLKHILHVLLKVDKYKFEPAAWRKVMDLVYKHFLLHFPMHDYSPESFCRNYLLIGRWMGFAKKPMFNDIVRRVMFVRCHQTPETANRITKSILGISDIESSADILVFLFEGNNNIIKSYFKHMEAAKHTTVIDEPISLKNLCLDTLQEDDLDNTNSPEEECMKVFNDITKDFMNTRTHGDMELIQEAEHEVTQDVEECIVIEDDDVEEVLCEDADNERDSFVCVISGESDCEMIYLEKVSGASIKKKKNRKRKKKYSKPLPRSFLDFLPNTPSKKAVDSLETSLFNNLKLNITSSEICLNRTQNLCSSKDNLPIILEDDDIEIIEDEFCDKSISKYSTGVESCSEKSSKMADNSNFNLDIRWEGNKGVATDMRIIEEVMEKNNKKESNKDSNANSENLEKKTSDISTQLEKIDLDKGESRNAEILGNSNERNSHNISIEMESESCSKPDPKDLTIDKSTAGTHDSQQTSEKSNCSDVNNKTSETNKESVHHCECCTKKELCIPSLPVSINKESDSTNKQHNKPKEISPNENEKTDEKQDKEINPEESKNKESGNSQITRDMRSVEIQTETLDPPETIHHTYIYGLITPPSDQVTEKSNLPLVNNVYVDTSFTECSKTILLPKAAVEVLNEEPQESDLHLNEAIANETEVARNQQSSVIMSSIKEKKDSGCESAEEMKNSTNSQSNPAFLGVNEEESAVESSKEINVVQETPVVLDDKKQNNTAKECLKEASISMEQDKTQPTPSDINGNEEEMDDRIDNVLKETAVTNENCAGFNTEIASESEVTGENISTNSNEINDNINSLNCNTDNPESLENNDFNFDTDISEEFIIFKNRKKSDKPSDTADGLKITCYQNDADISTSGNSIENEVSEAVSNAECQNNITYADTSTAEAVESENINKCIYQTDVAFADISTTETNVIESSDYNQTNYQLVVIDGKRYLINPPNTTEAANNPIELVAYEDNQLQVDSGTVLTNKDFPAIVANDVYLDESGQNCVNENDQNYIIKNSNDNVQTIIVNDIYYRYENALTVEELNQLNSSNTLGDDNASSSGCKITEVRGNFNDFPEVEVSENAVIDSSNVVVSNCNNVNELGNSQLKYQNANTESSAVSSTTCNEVLNERNKIKQNEKKSASIKKTSSSHSAKNSHKSSSKHRETHSKKTTVPVTKKSEKTNKIMFTSTESIKLTDFDKFEKTVNSKMSDLDEQNDIWQDAFSGPVTKLNSINTSANFFNAGDEMFNLEGTKETKHTKEKHKKSKLRSPSSSPEEKSPEYEAIDTTDFEKYIREKKNKLHKHADNSEKKSLLIHLDKSKLSHSIPHKKSKQKHHHSSSKVLNETQESSTYYVSSSNGTALKSLLKRKRDNGTFTPNKRVTFGPVTTNISSEEYEETSSSSKPFVGSHKHKTSDKQKASSKLNENLKVNKTKSHHHYHQPELPEHTDYKKMERDAIDDFNMRNKKITTKAMEADKKKIIEAIFCKNQKQRQNRNIINNDDSNKKTSNELPKPHLPKEANANVDGNYVKRKNLTAYRKQQIALSNIAKYYNKNRYPYDPKLLEMLPEVQLPHLSEKELMKKWYSSVIVRNTTVKWKVLENYFKTHHKDPNIKQSCIKEKVVYDKASNSAEVKIYSSNDSAARVSESSDLTSAGYPSSICYNAGMENNLIKDNTNLDYISHDSNSVYDINYPITSNPQEIHSPNLPPLQSNSFTPELNISEICNTLQTSGTSLSNISNTHSSQYPGETKKIQSKSGNVVPFASEIHDQNSRSLEINIPDNLSEADIVNNLIGDIDFQATDLYNTLFDEQDTSVPDVPKRSSSTLPLTEVNNSYCNNLQPTPVPNISTICTSLSSGGTTTSEMNNIPKMYYNNFPGSSTFDVKASPSHYSSEKSISETNNILPTNSQYYGTVPTTSVSNITRTTPTPYNLSVPVSDNDIKRNHLYYGSYSAVSHKSSEINPAHCNSAIPSSEQDYSKMNFYYNKVPSNVQPETYNVNPFQYGSVVNPEINNLKTAPLHCNTYPSSSALNTTSICSPRTSACIPAPEASSYMCLQPTLSPNSLSRRNHGVDAYAHLPKSKASNSKNTSHLIKDLLNANILYDQSGVKQYNSSIEEIAKTSSFQNVNVIAQASDSVVANTCSDSTNGSLAVPESEFSNSPKSFQEASKLVMRCLNDESFTEDDLSHLSSSSNLFDSKPKSIDLSLKSQNALNSDSLNSDQVSNKDSPKNYLNNESFSEKHLSAEFEEFDNETRLPLKKRRMSVYNENQQMQPQTVQTNTLKDEISYPATPMISIAELEALSGNLGSPGQINKPFKTPAERKELPPLPMVYGLNSSEPTPIIADQFNINNHTYNNPTINYHMSSLPLPFINVSYPPYYQVPSFILPNISANGVANIKVQPNVPTKKEHSQEMKMDPSP